VENIANRCVPVNRGCEGRAHVHPLEG
jgi:hypothetical protein